MFQDVRPEIDALYYAIKNKEYSDKIDIMQFNPEVDQMP